ncbi:MAG: 50S ribosomal protein L4 [Patescibacteria group bacterium]|nr:50S ribosomal protein L4 [Patescibacteria group bacterium]
MKAKLYNQNGESKGEITLNKDIFGIKPNEGLIHQALVMIQANKRTPIAHAKKRGEISVTGAKPHRQKGTGRARQGSSKSGHHRGGYAIFGPRNDRNFSKSMPKKQQRKALFSLLSAKAKDGNILALEDYNKEPKTKLIAETISKLPVKKTLLIVTDGKNEIIFRAAKNLKFVDTIEARNLNVEKVLKNNDLLFLQEAFKILEETFLKKTPVEQEESITTN